MTNKEAIEILNILPLDLRNCSIKQCDDIGEALGMAIQALQDMRVGKWEWLGPCRDGQGRLWATCSECGVRQRLGDYKTYCPHCGVKLE